MKKSFFLSTLFFTSLAFAHDYNYEVTPLIGYNMAEGNINVRNYLTYGGELQWNNISPSIKPELFILSGSSRYAAPRSIKGSHTTFNRIGMHGVYDLEKIKFLVPFAKAGLGYENLSNPSKSGNYNSVYADVGVGLKVFILPQIALKAEALYMLKNNNNRYDNNLNFLFGLTIALDQNHFVRKIDLHTYTVEKDDDNDGVINKKDKCPNTPKDVKVNKKGCPLDDDADGIANYLDQCPNTPYGVGVDDNGCELDSDADGVVDSQDMCPETPEGATVNEEGCQLDDDKDGVFNSDDNCPNTPKGRDVDVHGCQLDSDKDGVVDALDMCPNTPIEVKKVDQDGCFHKLNLNINFDTGSANVKESSLPHIQKFAKFLKTVPIYNVTIVGHTDNVGKKKKNLKLSKKRAKMVRKLLIQEGVDANSITAIGKGESEPVVSNDTPEGRAQNRRIEAILEKKVK